MRKEGGEMKKSALLPWMLALSMWGSKIIDWGSSTLDLGERTRTYKRIHHRSQKKLRKLRRQK